jgi:hypothetical protein
MASISTEIGSRDCVTPVIQEIFNIYNSVIHSFREVLLKEIRSI